LDYLTTHTSLSPIRRGFTPGLVYYKKGALDSQPQVIKFTNCLPMVDGSLRVLRRLLPLKLIAIIELKVALNTINQSIYLNLDIFVHLGLDANASLVRSSNQHFIWICIYRDRHGRDRMVNPTTIQSRPRLPPTIYLKYS
jgi:hypothetical protein